MKFRKDSGTVPRKNICNRLEELEVPFELRSTTIRLYENIIPKFKNIEGLLHDINCIIGVK